ncbi:MAG: DUF2846 domain-containing protein [Sideroxyarcus sp.]
MLIAMLAILTGCASVPMAPKEQDAASKTFRAPSANMAGVYIYRNSFIGKALTKALYIDGVKIGETANAVYFHKEVNPGEHTLATQAEFGDNSVKFNAEAGKNYFFQQYIKMGVFKGSAGIQAVSEEEGKQNVLQCSEAK